MLDLLLIGGVLGCYSHGYWAVISLLLEISGEKYDRRKKVRKTKQDQGGNWVFVGRWYGGAVIFGKRS